MKKHMIKILCGILSLTLTFSLASCAAKTGSETSPAEQTTSLPETTDPETPASMPESDPDVASLINAEIALDSYISAFGVYRAGRLDWTRTPYNRSKSFWTDAEIFEVLVDYVGMIGEEKFVKYMDAAFTSFQINYGSYTTWTWNDFNDDLMWITIATAKAYLYTENETYKDCATTVFNYTFKRAWTADYGGGLLWKMTETSKNSCVNYPAAIAACLLYQIYGDSKKIDFVDYPAGESEKKSATYLEVARSIYSWTNSVLRVCDSESSDYGRVFDTYDKDKNGDGKVTNEWSGTYNLGTCIGSATLLYEITEDPAYLEDAKATFHYTALIKYGQRMTVSDEANGNDLPGFKGIMMRWICYLVRNHYDEISEDMTKELDWLKRNVKNVWKNRNEENIIWTAWGSKTLDDMKDITVAGDDNATCYSSWGCSAALAFLVGYPYDLMPLS
ncbi:MAG: glycoside hydrolase family 76 protein [Eubacteriales bacterium]